MKTNRCSGFTLVEVVVAGILTAVLAGAGFSLFMMYTNETRKVAANLRMQRQYETLLEEISSKAREATLILSTDENLSSYSSSAPKATKEILMYKGTEVVGGFRFTNNSVEELDTYSGAGLIWKSFTIDGDQVQVDEAQSKFILSNLRKQIEVDIVLRLTNSKKQYQLTTIKGLYLCRI